MRNIRAGGLKNGRRRSEDASPNACGGKLEIPLETRTLRRMVVVGNWKCRSQHRCFADHLRIENRKTGNSSYLT
ncbi:MAG: hypothetical protein K9I74_08715 [Bacteroidales bacterium]|nr:hypothetical protein [Bacteroidales bacterium]